MTSYPLVDVPWAERRAEAMQAAFGAPQFVHNVPYAMAVQERVPVIHNWVYPNAVRGHSLIITEGLSDADLHDGRSRPAGYHLELMTFAKPGDENTAAASLRWAAKLIVSLYEGRAMDIGHTMTLATPPSPLWETALTRFVYLRPPRELTAAATAVGDARIREQPIRMLWCSAIAETELKVLAERGADRFAALLEQTSLALDPQRRLLA